MPRSWRQGGGGAPVLRPTLAGGRRRLQSAAASTPLCPATVGGDRESGLRPGAPPPPWCIWGGVPRLCMPPGCPGRWLGVRAQVRFAVAATIARTDAVDGATPANRKRCPASVGRRTYPGPPAPAPRLHAARCEPRQLADWRPSFQRLKANPHQRPAARRSRTPKVLACKLWM